MQNIKTTESKGKVVFESSLETVPGGGCVAVADINSAVTTIPAGTAVGKDSNGLFHVVKTARAYASATNTATAYPVVKGHPFKVGNIICLGKGKKAYTITSIDTSNASYDTINVNTTLGVVVNVDDLFIEATAESSGTGSDFKYVPFGLTGTDVSVVANDNHLVDIVVRGSVRSGNLPNTHSDTKAALPLIRFV